MARYFFHVDNGTFAPDPTGVELPDVNAARVEAVKAAGEAINDASDGFWEHATPWFMYVTEANGRLLFSLEFAAKVPSGEAFYLPTGGSPDTIAPAMEKAERSL